MPYFSEENTRAFVKYLQTEWIFVREPLDIARDGSSAAPSSESLSRKPLCSLDYCTGRALLLYWYIPVSPHVVRNNSGTLFLSLPSQTGLFLFLPSNTNPSFEFLLQIWNWHRTVSLLRHRDHSNSVILNLYHLLCDFPFVLPLLCVFSKL